MIYCFDIDGTICSITDGDYEDAKPFIDRIEHVNRLHSEGHKIVYFTARGSTTGIDWTKVTEAQLNKWVAKYRRQSNYQGRPSYGNTYSAINAVLGHYNNFGANTLFPKRRLERVVKEVDDAGRALGRGR